MSKYRQIALKWLPPLMTAGLLLQASAAVAAAPSGDAQVQARQILVGAGARPASRIAFPAVRAPARAGDAAQAARGLILSSPDQDELPLGAQTLQARVTPLAESRVARSGRQDAQAQARRLIHGGAV